MSRRHERRVDELGEPEQCRDFDSLVARTTRAGRSACQVGVDKRLDDFPAELLSAVEGIVWKAKLISHTTRVATVLGRAAAALQRRIRVFP